MWIYKHKLFHRDRPEDLYQVRRRTCPGVDGRKQRFSRFSAQKLSKYDEDRVAHSSDDDSSLDDTSGDESEIATSKKRRGSMSSVASSTSKRSRRLWQSEDERPMNLDTTIIPEMVTSPTSVFDAPKAIVKEIEVDDDVSTNKKSDRMEMMERSMIVSEVATKLEEFARKAMKGRGTLRNRRAGVVTPPYGYSRTAVISSRDLITYDDEYEDEEDVSGIVTDGDDSMHSLDISFPPVDEDSKDWELAPVTDAENVQRVVHGIRQRALCDISNGKVIHACADVAEFLMTTAPGEDVKICCSKILGLLASSDRLASDFYLYRSALHPNGSLQSSGPLYMNTTRDPKACLQRALESHSSRSDALREFKIFAVNLIYRLLGRNGSFDIKQPFSHYESSTLLRTADAWSRSVGRVA